MVSRVLIVTDDDSRAQLPADDCSGLGDGSFTRDLVAQIAAALEHLESTTIDSVVVDVAFTNSQGIAIFDQLFTPVRDTPIVIFSEARDESLAIEAVQRRDQDDPPQSRFGRSLLVRSLSSINPRIHLEGTPFIDRSRAETTLNAISDSVITTDIDGNVDYLNQAAEAMTGWSKHEAMGHPILEVMPIINGTTRKADRNPVDMVLKMDEPMGLTAGTILVRRDGCEVVIEDSASPIHDSGGNLCGAVIVFHDISASKDMREKMAHLAQHDFLTDLPNRLLFQDRLSQALELAARRGTTLAVLFLDLDNFKSINDSLGHEKGDEMLRSIAHRLSACVRGSDTVSRSGGDEFIILVLGDDEKDHTAIIADKILGSLAKPHLIGDHELTITTSIGISVYPADGTDTKTLCRKADLAMYEAKSQGGNNYQFYNSGMKTHQRIAASS